MPTRYLLKTCISTIAVFISCCVWASDLPNFGQQPDEIESFEEIFIKILDAKKKDLPPRYAQDSKLVESEFAERVFAVANDQCSNDDLFLADLYRNEVDDIIQELVSFACNQNDDGVVFYKNGQHIETSDSEDIIDLNARGLLADGLLELQPKDSFTLEVMTFGVKYFLRQDSPTKRSLTLEKKQSNGFKAEIHFEHFFQKEVGGEKPMFWWRTNFRYGKDNVYKQTKFLTTSQEHDSFSGVYQHKRYLNEFAVDPIEYLEQYDTFKAIIDELFKSDNFIIFNTSDEASLRF